MKKRILSLIMAVCMVVLALPVLVLPTVAAEKESFTTRFATNEPSTWPTFESGVGLKRWNGNWSIGYFDAGTYYQHFDFAKGNNIVTTIDPWTNTGVFLELGQVILTQGSAINNKDANAFYEPITFKGDPVSTVNKIAAAMTYTAPYTGTVELDMDSVYGVEREPNNIDGITKTQEVYFAIFVNGEMVWPNKGDHYEDPTKWMKLSGTQEFKDAVGEGNKITVDVVSRDKIQFAMALAPNGTSFAMMVPTVTYQAGYSVVPETVAQSFAPNDRDWPEIGVVAGEGMPLEQPSQIWKMGSFNKATGDFTAFTQYTTMNNGSGFAHIAGAEGDTDKPWIKAGGILLNFPNRALIGAMSVSKDANLRAAYTVESIANGKATVSLAGLMLSNATGDAVKNASVNLEIYVNGTLKGEKAIETNAKGEIKNNVAIEVNVARGDKIAIVADDFGSVAYVGGTPVITYANIQSFMHQTPSGENAIAVEKVDVAVNGSIDFVINAFATRNVYENSTEVILYVWDNTVTGAKTPANAIAALPMEMNTDLYSFEAIYNDFAIKCLADELTVQAVVMDGDSKLCESEQTVVSIADAAFANYENANDKKVKTMYANLLNYGAYAQIYFNHNTENLANKNLPEALKALDYEMLYDAQFDATKPSGSSTRVCDSEIGSFALILENTISIRAYIDRYKTEMGDQHKFYFQYGESLAACLNAQYVDFPADGNLSYTIKNIGAHEMGQVHYIRCIVTYPLQIGTGTRDMAYFGYTMSYSVESYASRMLESTELGLEDLVRAMMEFGKAAAAVY